MSEYIETLMNGMIKEFLKKQEQIIKDAFIKAGIDVNDIQFIKDNVERIVQDGDPFEHYWYRFGKPDAKRIISIEINPRINEPLLKDNKYTVTSEQHYY